MPERTPEHCHYTIIAPEGPGRVTPHPILGWDCGRAGMPTARSTARSTGTVYRTWSYLRYVSHISVWSNSMAVSLGGSEIRWRRLQYAQLLRHRGELMSESGLS